MNYLAHIYLSNEEEEITLGNFIADGIKGKKYIQFPLGIQQGILLHRAIDSFTDAHPIVRKSTRRLHKKYGHYSGVIVDILYDHFLAKNWMKYHSIPLHKYIENLCKKNKEGNIKLIKKLNLLDKSKEEKFSKKSENESLITDSNNVILRKKTKVPYYQ